MYDLNFFSFKYSSPIYKLNFRANSAGINNKLQIERKSLMQTNRMLYLVITIVVLLIGNNVVASPVVIWHPAKIELKQMQGTRAIYKIIVKSDKDFYNITAHLVPGPQPWVSISPVDIEVIQKDGNIEITLKIDVSPYAIVGKYFGTIQLKQAIDGGYQRVIDKFLPITLSITDQENNELPPDPGEAGMKTILGIDSDSDGVRDDIQRYIYFVYPDDEKVRMALTQMAIEYQGLLSEASDPDAAFNHATRMSRHGECLFYILGEASLDVRSALKAEILNTRERSIAFINYSDSLAGEIIFGKPVKDWKNSCNFDVDAIGGSQ
jgi:hypothetical protein